MRALTVNKTKITSTSAFCDKLFVLESDKESKKLRKGPSFETTLGFLTCILTRTRGMPHICSCLDCFSFSHFSLLLVAFIT